MQKRDKMSLSPSEMNVASESASTTRTGDRFPLYLRSDSAEKTVCRCYCKILYVTL